MTDKPHWFTDCPDGNDRECSINHTYSGKVKDWGGWETDSGHNGYGLSKELCDYIVSILNSKTTEVEMRRFKWSADDDETMGERLSRKYK
jgi:hypothetical protein